MEVEPRRTLRGRYQLQAELGHGGMGRVWRAHDTHLNRTVAVKEILQGVALDERERERVATRARREAQATAMGQHPNIVTVHDIVEEDGRPWIVMELLQGRSLHALVQSKGPCPVSDVAGWGLELLDALETAHAQGITHRDVKPENVMITDTGRVVLTDFGIATLDDGLTLTQTASVVGSPAYLAPERLAGKAATAASDLWSLGATLFYARTGLSPFQRQSLPATMHAILWEPTPQGLGAGPLAEAITGLLVKDPEQRHDAHTCGRLLHRAAQDPQATDVHPGGVAPTARMSGAVPAPAPVPPTERLATQVGAGAEPGGQASPRATSGAATPPGAFVPPRATPPGAAPRPGRGMSWPVVVLTLGLAFLLLVTGALVLDPWGIGTTLTGQRQEQGQEGGAQDQGEGEEGEGEGAPGGQAQEEQDGEPFAEGMTWTENPAEGYSVLVPEGWSPRVQDNSTFYESPEENAYLQVDTTPHPTDDEYEHIQTQHQDAPGRMPQYQRVGAQDITQDTDFHSAADWEFTWNQGGTDRHVLARNITVSPGEHYSVVWASDEDVWGRYTPWRAAALDSFEPS